MTERTQNWEMGRQTRYFNGTLRKLRLEKGCSQEEMAKVIGTSKVAYGNWERLKSIPDQKFHARLEEVFGRKFEEIFPEFLELLKDKQTVGEDYIELTPQMLEAHAQQQRLLGQGEDDVEVAFVKKMLEGEINNLIDQTLDGREKKIISMRFGLNGQRPHTLEETAREYSVTRERIRVIEAKALSRLRKAFYKTSIREDAELAYGFSPLPHKVKIPPREEGGEWWKK